MSVEVKQILKPKKYGSGGTTIIRGSGYATTTNNSSVNTNNNVSILNATNITATQGNIDVINSSSITSNNVNATNINVQTLNVNGVSTLQDLDVNNITQHGNFIMQSTEYANTFNVEQVVSYLGSHNYFDELTGSELSNITSHNINTEYLTVTKSAHFFELIIDKVKAAGGSVLFTPADGFKIDDVEENVPSNYYRLYWRACSEIAEGTEGQTLAQTGQTLTENFSVNMWKVGDQARCQTFNLSQYAYSYSSTGSYGHTNNTYWWRTVSSVSNAPIVHSINGIKYYCHYIDVYHDDDGHLSYVDAYSYAPVIGDEVAMLGSRINQERQGAVYIASNSSIDNDLKAPLFAEYEGINDFNLTSHKKNWIATGTTSQLIPSTQIKGNIVLSSSNQSVEDYVDAAVAGIETGDEFYTNFLSFENQNINAPCLYNGVVDPRITTLGSNMWCLHGDNKLNISSISSSFNGATVSYSGNTARVEVPSINYSYLSDLTTTIPVTVFAYLSGNVGPTKQYDGSLYITKVKNGTPGIDGITPVVYELASDTRSRTLTYSNTQQSLWTIEPSTFRITINKIDASNTTPVSNVTEVPDGMTLFYRIFNIDTETYGDYINITSTFNINGYYDWAFTDSYKYGAKFYLYNEEVDTSLSPSNFDDTKIYDVWDVPLLINGTDGQNGTNGTNGVNGKNIYVDMSKAKACVGLDDKLTVEIQGQAYYRNGDTIDSSYDFSYYTCHISNDNAYSGIPGYIGTDLANISYLTSGGAFSFTKTGSSAISNWHTYDSIYRPTVLYVNIEDSRSSMASNTINVPITFESGATLEITNQITSTVQNQAGEISTLQQSADRIGLSVVSQNVVDVNQFKKADIPSDWLTDAWTRSPNVDNAIKRDTTVTHNGNTSVCVNMRYDTSGNVFFPIVYQYLDKEIPAGTQFLISCYFKYTPASGQTTITNSVFGLDIQTDNTAINPTPIGFYIDDIYKRAGYVGNSDKRCFGQIELSDILNTNWHKITFVCKTGNYVDANKLMVRLFGWHSGTNDDTPHTIDPTKQPKFYFTEPIVYIDNGADITKNLTDSLNTTGIDITQGLITLNSQNTVINSDLDLHGTFDSYNSTSWDEIILNAGTGQVLKVRGASYYRDVSGELIPATTATHVDLAKINIKKDADSLRSYPELTLQTSGSNTPDMTINTEGIEIDKDNYNLYIGADQVNCKFPLYGTNDVSYPTISKEWQYIIGRGYNEATYTYSREISWTDDFAVITGGGASGNPYILPQTSFGKQLIIFNNSNADIWIATANGDDIIGLGSSNTRRALAPKRCLTFTHSNGGNTWYITSYA